MQGKFPAESSFGVLGIPNEDSQEPLDTYDQINYIKDLIAVIDQLPKYAVEWQMQGVYPVSEEHARRIRNHQTLEIADAVIALPDGNFTELFLTQLNNLEAYEVPEPTAEDSQKPDIITHIITRVLTRSGMPQASDEGRAAVLNWADQNCSDQQIATIANRINQYQLPVNNSGQDLSPFEMRLNHTPVS